MATFDSVSCGTVDLNGTFDYPPPNPPTSPNGSLGTYTLDDGTALTMTGMSTTGATGQYSITPAAGGQTYSFNGADSSWTASAQ